MDKIIASMVEDEINSFSREKWWKGEEKETIIYFDLLPEKVVLYTSNWRVANLLIKRGLKPERIHRTKQDHLICGMDFIADKQQRQKLGKLLSVQVLVPRRNENIQNRVGFSMEKPHENAP